MTTSEDQHGDLCGEAYDHDLREIGESDGLRTSECRTCGAEIVEELEGES